MFQAATDDDARTLTRTAESRAPIDLDRVYREHAATVSRWARRLSGSGEPHDVVQEVFEVAQRRLASFRGDSQITTWLYSITVSVVGAKRRKARLRQILFLGFASEAQASPGAIETPFDSLHRNNASRVVYAVLDRLNERDRTLLILFELERLSTQEISSILELSLNSVSVSLHRARARFRKLLHKHFPEEAEGMDNGKNPS